ncbi:MAG: DUF2683 family protein [Candidatus Aenigmatarchaeota archaeon]
MVKAMIDIDEHANRVLNVVKAKYDLPSKSEAINVMALQFEEELLEPELRPEFIEKMEKARKEKPIAVKNFDKMFGLK